MSTWTDERVAQMVRMWEAGDTAAQIASALGGVSRNAVIGRLHRMGLSGRVKVAGRRPKPRPVKWDGLTEDQRILAVRERLDRGWARQDIANALGTTVHRVAGLCERHDLRAPAVTARSLGVGLSNRRRAPAPKFAETRPAADVVPLQGGVTLPDLTHRSCRWPLGEPSDLEMRYCGCRAAEGASYCEGHMAVAYRPCGGGSGLEAHILTVVARDGRAA